MEFLLVLVKYSLLIVVEGLMQILLQNQLILKRVWARSQYKSIFSPIQVPVNIKLQSKVEWGNKSISI